MIYLQKAWWAVQETNMSDGCGYNGSIKPPTSLWEVASCNLCGMEL